MGLEEEGLLQSVPRSFAKEYEEERAEEMKQWEKWDLPKNMRVVG